MRWPLRNQLLFPMVGVMLCTLLIVSFLNAYVSAHRARLRIEHELREVTSTLADSSFPLNDSVLRKMRGLTGAEFLLCNHAGDTIASSAPHDRFANLPIDNASSADQSLALAKSIAINQHRYFHTAMSLRRIISSGQPTTLHILYSEQSYRQAWWDAVYPPLVVGGLAVVAVVFFALVIASRVVQPLRRLQSQVEAIAEGNFQSMPVPRRDDEIADLSLSVNRMAEMLARYEVEVRRHEQLRTLGQLGGGIAHQMRNAATGCRMAVELHARDCPMRDADECLAVATRQLELMERYLQRFLALGRRGSEKHSRVEMTNVIKNVVALVEPTARHVGVQLECDMAETPIAVDGDADALEQLMVNLAVNAIEAASQIDSSKRPSGIIPSVSISLRQEADRVLMEVTDTGPGPAESVQKNLFEPFVTEKPDGTGLGLSVAKETVLAHGGQIHWSRRESVTCFTVELPIATAETV